MPAQPFVLVGRALATGTHCGVITPREVPWAIWLPTERIPYILFWVSVLVVLVLLGILWLEVFKKPFPWLRYLLFVVLMALVSLLIYGWPWSGGIYLLALFALAIIIFLV